MSIELRTLHDISIDEVAESFLAAFADYDMVLDKEKLLDMLQRRGADLSLSVGAFDCGQLVSFIINGIGSFDRITTAYDTGTGTVIAYRGMGLTDSLFKFSLPVLRDAGVRQYLLEVLQHNTPAVKIYRRQGFQITREFNCYTKTTGRLDIPAPAPDIEIRPVDVGCLKSAFSFFDFNPSWQNCLESIFRHPEAFLCFGAFAGTAQIGFCATESAYGDISLLAVSPSYRRRGIGRQLLNAAIESNRDTVIRAINIETSSQATNAFFNACGFSLSYTQFEMLRQI